MRRNRMFRPMVVVVLAVSLVAAGCGDDDEERSASPAAEGTTTGVTDISVKVGGLGTIESAGS